MQREIWYCNFEPKQKKQEEKLGLVIYIFVLLSGSLVSKELRIS